MSKDTRVEFSRDMIEAFCRKWKIKELAFFGSVLRADFAQDSDVDVLTTFSPDANWSLLDVARMRGELSALLGRETEVVEASTLRNPFRRSEIFATRKIIYAS